MGVEKSSLIQQAKTQMDLLPSSAMPAAIFEEGEQALAGDFTGERLFKQRPETYQLIISLAAERTGMLRIAKLLKVSVNTVRAVLQREGRSVDTQKKEIAEACYQGAALAVEAAVEDLSDPAKRAKVPLRDKVMAAAILVDKGQLLAGEATSRMEVTEIRAPDHDDFNRYVEGLRSANTGQGVGNPAQKGAAGDRVGDLAVVKASVMDVVAVEESSEGKQT